jgi:hypothetical protein
MSQEMQPQVLAAVLIAARASAGALTAQHPLAAAHDGTVTERRQGRG